MTNLNEIGKEKLKKGKEIVDIILVYLNFYLNEVLLAFY